MYLRFVLQGLTRAVAFCAVLSWAIASQNGVPESNKEDPASPTVLNTDDSSYKQPSAPLLNEMQAPLKEQEIFDIPANEEQFAAYKIPKKCPKKVIASTHLKQTQASPVKTQPAAPTLVHKASATAVHHKAILAPIAVVLHHKKPPTAIYRFDTSASNRPAEVSSQLVADKEAAPPGAEALTAAPPSAVGQVPEKDSKTVLPSITPDSSPQKQAISAAPEYAPAGYYVSKPKDLRNAWILIQRINQDM